MTKFERVCGVAAPLDRDDIDTDTIIPQRWLVTTTREGLGKGLFSGLRFTDEGTPRPEFVLNRPEYVNCKVIIAGANYGCGSSREHAVWAHVDAGIRALVAPSYGPIFYDNCFKSGVLPVLLDAPLVTQLMSELKCQPGAKVTIDLAEQIVVFPDESRHLFRVDKERRRRLLAGLDDIALTLALKQRIVHFQKVDHKHRPWVWDQGGNVPTACKSE